MRVAVWIYGGIGGGNFSQGCPHIVRLIEELSMNNEITIYSILPSNHDFVPAGYTFKTVPRYVPFGKLRMVLLAIRYLYDHILKPYHLLHAFWGYPAGTLAVVLGKIARVPSVVALQGGEGADLPEIGYGNMTRYLSRKITLWTCEQATVLISISKFLMDNLYEHGMQKRNVVLLPFGADTATFKAAEKPRGAVLKILHVANLNLVKDQGTLLKAFALILKEQPAELKIVGDGVMSEALQRQVDELGITHAVTFAGAVPNIHLPQHYAWADMMLHTSLYEGQGVVICEALASKVVVCGTRVGMLADLAEVCCAVSAVGDYETIAARALALWKDATEYARLRDNGYQWAMQHTVSWSVKELQAVYEAIQKN